MKMDYAEAFRTLLQTLRAHPRIALDEEVFEAPVPPPHAQLLAAYPDISTMYDEIGRIRIRWHMQDDDDPDRSGGVEIIPASAFDDGGTAIELVDAALDEAAFAIAPPTRKWNIDGRNREVRGRFHPIELIEDQCMVGVFEADGIGRSEVFFYDAGITFRSLRVDWRGYVQLLCASYGIRYWQLAIVQWEHGEPDACVDAFESMLSELAPAYGLDSFERLWRSLRRARFET
jgi:hypothetical protein